MGLGKLVSIVACAGPLAAAMLVRDRGGAHDIGLMDVARLVNRTGKTETGTAAIPKILVFGDRWAYNGCGANLLETMFADKEIQADVRHERGHLTGACTSATKDPEVLLKAAQKLFPEGPPDYLWYTVGGMDLMHPEEPFLKTCTETNAEHAEEEGEEEEEDEEEGTKREEKAIKCLKEATMKTMNKCTDTMLKTMWEHEGYGHVKVVQAGYDFSCDEGFLCSTVSDSIRWGLCKMEGVSSMVTGAEAPEPHFCGSDRVCHRRMFMHWQDFLLGGDKHDFGRHSDKYTGINILGAMQKAHGYEGVELGKPDVNHGSPCSDTFLCTGPRKGTPGYTAIADAFWSKYFEKEMQEWEHED